QPPRGDADGAARHLCPVRPGLQRDPGHERRSRALQRRPARGAPHRSHMAKLHVDQITVPLRTFRLELSLEVSSTLALVGPSGAGKTTVLRAVAGLTRPESGRIAVDDDVLFDGGRRIDLPPEQRRVGLVFQEYALFPHMNVRRNIEYAGKHTADDY